MLGHQAVGIAQIARSKSTTHAIFTYKSGALDRKAGAASWHLLKAIVVKEIVVLLLARLDAPRREWPTADE
jgi:hypothetical protein